MNRKEPKKVDLSADIAVHCAFKEMANVSELKANPRNYNKHPDQQIALLAKNIRALGWRHPIIVSKLSGKIVAGHARLEAAKLLSLQVVPVDYQSFASLDEETAYLIADNKIAELAEIDSDTLKDLLDELAKTDIDMDLTGFTAEKLTEILQTAAAQESSSKEIDVDGIVCANKCPRCGFEFEKGVE
jgi:ParB-like chromosome segregation protein Spo0J